MPRLPLEDLKVLDLSRLLPGPYCTLVLADLGADVVKVEDPRGGDYIRWMPPLVGEQSALFHALNRNKRSIALDLKSPEGNAVLLELVAGGYDVVVESFRPGVMDRLGLGWEALRAAAPGVILCSISGYGQTGPMRERAGHDINYVGLAGVLGYTGTGPGAPPGVLGVQVGDVGGGSYPAAVGILAALHARAQHGEGAWLDISMTDGALGFMTMHLGAAFAGGAPPRGEALLGGGRPCYGVYATRDGRYVTLGALEPHFWQRFCAAVERPDLAGEGLAAGEEGERVRAEVAAVFAARTREEWMAFFGDHDVCCEPVRDLDEVRDDPQLSARGDFFEIDDPRDGPVTHVATPVRFVGGAPAPQRPAPALGGDTDAVLEAAGISEGRRAELRDAGVIP